jgi:hypothetical protein
MCCAVMYCAVMIIEELRNAMQCSEIVHVWIHELIVCLCICVCKFIEKIE